MKYINTLLLTGIILSLAGCTSTDVTDQRAADTAAAVSDIAGTWRGSVNGWEIIIGSDQKIKSVVIPLGKIRMVPGRATTVPAKKDGYGIFEPGVWKLDYNPESRFLNAEIEIGSFYMDIGTDSIEGTITYYLKGTVSEDGKKWTADCCTTNRFIADTGNPRQFSDVKEPEFRNRVIFQKN